MLKAYKYRIYPSQSQIEEINIQMDGARFMYNLGLETKISAYLGTKKVLNFFDLCKQAVELKKEYIWVKKIHSQIIQNSLKNLDDAYKKFFEGNKFPKFKCKNDKQSIQVTQGVKVDFNKNKVFFPKIKWMDCIFSRKFQGSIKTCTITKTPTNKYFISILVDNQVQLPNKKPIVENTSVGIDVGIKTLLTLSDGKFYSNLNFLKKNLKRLKIEQKKLSKKFNKEAKKQSNSYLKQKLLIAKLHEKIANQRKDYLHKISTKIVKNYDTIIIETLDVLEMAQNNSFSKYIYDVSWSSFYKMIRYKCQWYGKNLVQINQYEPSSKICSNCGVINQNLKLSDRIWTCQCGITHDRDLNAAVNIKEIGLRVQPLQKK